MKDIKVVVATHKKYKMADDKLYLPLHVGREGKDFIGYDGDNIGDNISKKNLYFCELTGLYWAWKNINADYIGLAHYRRYFRGNNRSKNKYEKILTYKETDNLLGNIDIILPKERKYYIENLYDHYKHTMFIEPLDMTREIIAEKYPKYLQEFDKLKKRTKAHMFNMLIMKKEILNNYCQWLFDILFELEKRNDKTYDVFHSRFYGRISELLLDVYIYTNHLCYKEVPIINMENTNYFKKGLCFLQAKILGKKYEKSF